MGRKSEIKSGYRIGKIIVIYKCDEWFINSKGIRRSVWLCRCDCGVEFKLNAGELKKPYRISCGCAAKDNARIQGKKQKTEESYLNYKYGDCKRAAKNRGIEFSLSKEEFKLIIVGKCYYCDSLPIIHPPKNVGIAFPTNGVDRIDSNGNYKIGNVVSCCFKCNFMKSNLSLTDFKDHIRKIYLHMEKFK